MGFVRRIIFGLVLLTGIIFPACASTGSHNKLVTEAKSSHLHQLSKDTYTRIFILYPELIYPIKDITDDMVYGVGLKNPGSYVSACFEELTEVLWLMLDDQEKERVIEYAEKISKLIIVGEDYSMSDESRNNALLVCLGIRAAIEDMMKTLDYKGDFQRGFKI